MWKMLFAGLVAAAVSTVAPAQAAAPNAATAEARPDVQQQRLALIQSLIGAGVLDRIERPRDIARVWVRPRFYAADFSEKRKIVGVVHAYFAQLHPGTDYVAVYDATSGKRVGRFSVQAGGLVMD
ncbi:hypothetical protein [Pseudaquabacterium pictum]|uniref:Uncharacterized protein n=1 Tax=Pseudaquabacterium pictum TaxID=2315236 RepID=A0A480AW45_9BURK|nr:hypothetical protein [Rubrivivax pictus]GCL64327.1 hypothetical protein AQPW35_34080 [Rubrivivax pictus]